jgi:hypothetical protein
MLFIVWCLLVYGVIRVARIEEAERQKSAKTNPSSPTANPGVGGWLRM